MKMKLKQLSFLFLFILGVCFCGCSAQEVVSLGVGDSGEILKDEKEIVDVEDVPDFSGEAYVTVNGNVPEFSEEDYTEESFEDYSALDSLGRCGVAYANVGTDIMPTEERDSIRKVRPSGWQTAKYNFISGKYLYNRCHLIGFQLAGENANEKNLITGTRYMNVDGMLPFENEVADYVKETDNHVLYRVTPIYEGNDLVAKGVQMEAYSVEDQGDGVSFNVFVYNNQPGVEIDYATGNSHLDSASAQTSPSEKQDGSGNNTPKKSDGKDNTEGSSKKQDFILNKKTDKFHIPSCPSVADTNKENKETYYTTEKELEDMGYDPCQRCLKK